ncbi:MAG TPA: hypothetical protein VMJ10_31430 [Kofleriaceae bacterium]|nr:hypothetical protein [Kofleriaceae bacterium]
MRATVWAIATAVACGGGHGVAPDAISDSPADAARDAAWVSAWNAPTGDPLTGVTLADGWTDLRALSPSLEIPHGWTDSLFAEPSGRELVFAYEQTDFFDFYISNGTDSELTGPPLAGVSAPTFEIFQADLEQTDWQVSEQAIDAFDPTATQASPSLNQAGDLIVFTRFDATGRGRLFWSQRVAGQWSNPSELSIDSAACSDDNAKIVGDLASGLTVYFDSTRSDVAGTSTTCGAHQVYTATFANGAFSPVSASAGISTLNDDNSQPFASADQQTLYWTALTQTQYGIAVATRQVDGSFGDQHYIAQPTTAGTFSGNVALIGEASVVDLPEGSLLYMMCGVAMNTHGGMTFHDADYIQLEPCVARRPH